MSKKSARTSQLLNDYALGLTPLSILSSMGSNCKDSKRAHESYEEKVKKRSFKPDGRSKQGFGLDYRDGGSSPPPGLPETNADDRGLKTMDISTVIPGVAPAGSASDPNLPVHARSRAIEGSPHYHPDLVPSTQPISAEIGKQPKVSSTAAVPSPKEGSPKPCLPFSSVNSSSAHDSFNIIRGFNNPLNTNSRLFPESTSLIMKTQSSRERLFSTDERNADRLPTGDPAQGDQGDDSDDDLATESDLETHADDDDYHYAPHPGEDEGYDSLRSEFKRVKLGKRSRAEVENTWLEDKAKKSLESTASSEGNVGDGRSPKDNTWTDAQTEDGGKTKKSRIEAENPTQDGQDLQRTTS